MVSRWLFRVLQRRAVVDELTTSIGVFISRLCLCTNTESTQMEQRTLASPSAIGMEDEELTD